MRVIIIAMLFCLMFSGVSSAENTRDDLEKRIVELEKKVKLLEFKDEVRAMLEKVKLDGAPMEKYFSDVDKRTTEYLLKSNGEIIDRLYKLEHKY